MQNPDLIEQRRINSLLFRDRCYQRLRVLIHGSTNVEARQRIFTVKYLLKDFFTLLQWYLEATTGSSGIARKACIYR